jgi:hypothetical protein
MLDIPIGSSSRKGGILEIIKITKLRFVAPILCKVTPIYVDMTSPKFHVKSVLLLGESFYTIFLLFIFDGLDVKLICRYLIPKGQ